MNEPTNKTGGGGFGDTFSSQPAPTGLGSATGTGTGTGSNPFTADLKGEFTSNFGTNTNAVSQIFKEGGFVGQNKKKYMIIGGVVLVVVAILAFALFPTSEEEGDTTETATEDGATEEGGEEVAEGEGEKKEEDGAATAQADGEAKPEEKVETTPEASTGESSQAAASAAVPRAAGGDGAELSGAITLSEPEDGSSLNYDESQGPAVFRWTGGGGHIVFSRNASMNPVVYRIKVSGNEYAFNQPWPGTWYWKVENASGATEVRSFRVNSPTRRSLQITEPTGGSVAGNGGVIAWQGDSSIAYYRVELSTSGWANPTHRFATSGNSVKLEGVAAGSYQMRLGAFSEVSGRFEYTSPSTVTVQ